MKKLISLTIALNLFFIVNSQNVGIGTTTPAASAKLEISSNNKGFLPPRMTEAERNNILNPVDGLIIFNITTGTINFYFNGVWNEFTAVPLGAIGTLNCAGATASGVLTEGVSASGVSSSISYTGGNGRKHSGQTVGSTGVTGLTATLPAGNFANGSGNLVYTITGIPASSGTASFELNIGGKTCTLTRMVNIVGAITTLNCAESINSGMLTQGIAANGVSSSVPYAGGNGGTYASQIVTSTGVTGLTATLPAGSFTNGVGNLIFTITGTPTGNGTASFALNIGGQACTLNRSVNMIGTISSLNCAGATHTGSITGGIPASSISSVITYTGGNNGGHNGQTVTSTGVSGLTATLAPGIFANGIGILTYDITGTPSGSGTASFALNIGGQTCTLTRIVNPPIGNIVALNCTGTTNTGILINGAAASGVSSSVPYTGGNGGTHSGQTVTSTGVTGLTATLTGGTFAIGAGSLTYTITGTPASSGTASFALNIGGQTCTLTRTVNLVGTYPLGSVFCTGTPTVVVDVTNPTTGKTWMDRNLGANRVASSINDEQAFGDLYQWGRRADGHQCRNSVVTSVLSSIDQPAQGSFILAPNPPSDWRTPQNLLLWQGANGINNPCPYGYRIPTETELNAERSSWSSNNSMGAFASPVKLHVAGRRDFSLGSLNNVETAGFYWSSTVSGTDSRNLFFQISGADMVGNGRANGLSVRCIKEIPNTQGAIQSLACASATNTGTLTSGSAASGVSSSVPYNGGNGATHSGQTVTSTGVTGLTATLTGGTFAIGAGSLTYTITGTPASSGTASFALSIGGQSCILSWTILPVYREGTVHCTPTPTPVVEVLNPATGKIWMDRNLGAWQVATSSTDEASYGDLYQWGRRADGHQCRNSPTTDLVLNTDQPPHGNFVVSDDDPLDWRIPQNSSLWQGLNGINNPCPNGYRIPTEAELNGERTSWGNSNGSGAFASPLKMPLAGVRIYSNPAGGIINKGELGYYWSSSVNNSKSNSLIIHNTEAYIQPNARVYGFTVRCIKD